MYSVQNQRGDKVTHVGNMEKQYGCGCDFEYKSGWWFDNSPPYLEVLPHAYLIERFKEEFSVELSDPNDKLDVQIFYQKDIQFAPNDLEDKLIDWSQAAHQNRAQTATVCANLLFWTENGEVKGDSIADIYVAKDNKRLVTLNPNELPKKYIGLELHQPLPDEVAETDDLAEHDLGAFGDLKTGYVPKWRWFYIRMRNHRDKPLLPMYNHTYGWTWASKAFGRKMDPSQENFMPNHNTLLNPAFDHNYDGWEGNGGDDGDDGLIG